MEDREGVMRWEEGVMTPHRVSMFRCRRVVAVWQESGQLTLQIYSNQNRIPNLINRKLHIEWKHFAH